MPFGIPKNVEYHQATSEVVASGSRDAGPQILRTNHTHRAEAARSLNAQSMDHHFEACARVESKTIG